MNPEFTRVPHRTHEVPIVQTAALLIDFDNVTMGIRSNLGQELRRLLDSDIIRGKVAVQRAYADWRRYPQYIVPLSEASIDLIFAPAYGSSKKNATDIRLAIDACELVFTRPEIGTFILLSGDSDFSSLVLKLKEYGKYVIGVGLQESASDILVQNCDEYYSYTQVSGLRSAGEIDVESHDPWALVSKAILRMVDRGDVMRSDRLKQVMLEIDPNFDEKGAGYSKFNRFLAEATHRDLIEMRKGQNGQYEVAPGRAAREGDAGSGGGEAASPVPRSSEGRNRRGGRGRSRGEGQRDRGEAAKPPETAAEAPAPAGRGNGPEDGLRQAYEALAAVVVDMYDGSEPVRDSMAKRRLIARDAGFDEAKLGFPKFSLFLRQAHEDGVVRLEQHENGNFYLTPIEGAKGGRRPDTGGPSARTVAAPGEGRKPAKKGLLDRLFGGRGKEAEPSAGGARSATEARPAEARPAGAGRGGPVAKPDAKPEARAETRPGADAKRRDESDRPRGGRGDDRQGRDESRASGGGDRGRGGSRDRERAGDRRGGRGRGGRGAGQDRGGARRTESRGEPRRESAPAARPEPKPEASRPEPKPEASRPERQPEAPRPERQPEAPRPEPQPEARTTPAREESSDDARRLGRYRRGSRGRSPTAAAGGGSVASRIGPLPRDGESETAGKKAEGGQKADRPVAEESHRAGVGARRGSRGRGGGAAPEARPEKAAPSPEAAHEEDDGSSSGTVDYMIRHYAGVGKRTAEVLVETFGEDVFDVIDRQPERLTEVLSEGRARAVVAAREKEREG